MSDAKAFGPWIESDGTSCPQEPGRYQFVYEGDGRMMTPGAAIGAWWSGFYWSWRRRYILFGPRERVCRVAGFAPIVAWRRINPPTEKAVREGYAALDILTDIAAGRRAPSGPEGPVRRRERSPDREPME